MQKWEYAYIWHANNAEIALIYLHPDGARRLGLDKDKKGSLFKTADYGEQIRVWVTELGNQGYEMTGITSLAYPDSTIREYWFKRPLTSDQ